MINKILPGIVLCVSLSGNAALAQTTELKPGLWDLTSLIDGKPVFSMLSDLPPDAPKEVMEMVHKTMRAYGIGLTENGVRFCLDKKSMKRAFGNIGPCKQTIDWDGDTGNMTMKCQGEPDQTGVIEILSDKQWRSTTPTTNAETGNPETVVSEGQWVSADCQGLKPQ